MTKSEAIAAICSRVENDLQRMIAAARAVEAAATDPENRPENKYDTRGVEASYLAAGQSEQVEGLANALRLLRTPASYPDFRPTEGIGSGALVELDIGGERDYFLLAPSAGGIVVEIAGNELTVLAPGAPLRGKLEGRSVGERLDDPSMRIVSVM
jgi:hypothetical protein